VEAPTGGDPPRCAAGGAGSLDEALARMTWSVEQGSFALVGCGGPPAAEDLAALAPPAQLVREADETTLLLREEALADVLARHAGARVQRDLAWIRFDAPLGWDVVGFLARVTGALAAAGVPLGCVCGYDRDHLFVARAQLARARAALAELFPEA
jgi:hypothetical protein